MEIRKLNDEEDINRLAGDEFLQSKKWADLVAKSGEALEIWGVFEDNKLLASATLIKKKLGGGLFYWYSPRGPRGEINAINFLLSELKNKKTGAVFLRIEPETLPSGKIKKSFDLQPQKTLFLDLSLGADGLLKAMHQKTRYNIRLAEKKGIKIVAGSLQDFPEFWRLMSVTGSRDGFRLHSAAHYQNLLSAPEFIKLFFASHEGKNIATGLFSYWGKRVTYLHGASDNEARNLMAPYLLQWEVIKNAQDQGYKYYDFYGIDENKWPGVTRFKLGFGGFIKEYAGTHDYIFRPFIYGLYVWLRKLKRLIK